MPSLYRQTIQVEHVLKEIEAGRQIEYHSQKRPPIRKSPFDLIGECHVANFGVGAFAYSGDFFCAMWPTMMDFAVHKASWWRQVPAGPHPVGDLVWIPDVGQTEIIEKGRVLSFFNTAAKLQEIAMGRFQFHAGLDGEDGESEGGSEDAGGDEGGAAVVRVVE